MNLNEGKKFFVYSFAAIFDELSNGGNITMPLQDMFFGSYFGEFSDKFGINWMINFQNPQ